jgi:hypothetical protein
MSSPYRNPERRVAAARLLPITLATLLAVSTNNALAQQDTVLNAHRGPNAATVTGLLPNGGAVGAPQ